MTTILETGRIRYAERKVKFNEESFEEWKRDHDDANDCYVVEQLIHDVNELFDTITALDRSIHESYFDGLPFNEALSEKLAELFGRWLKLATGIESDAMRSEEKSFEVSGVKQLRKNIREALAILNTSDQIDGWIADLRDKAMADYAVGKTDEAMPD